MKKTIFILSMLFLSLSAISQDITGLWRGVLKLPQVELDLFFRISQGENDLLSGTLSIPLQGIKDYPIDTTSFQNGELKIVVNGLGPQMIITGYYTLNSFIGEFSQMSKRPITLVRAKRPQEPKPPYPYKEEDVRFKNEKSGITLAGTLTIPEGEGPFPAVILVSGSGTQNRDEEIVEHKPFHVIADYLTQNGIMVLRYDDRGAGESEMAHPATTYDLSLDAESAIDYLKQRNDADQGQIGIIGHSEGGTIAFMVASRSDDVNFMISLAGGAILGAETLISQDIEINKLSGASQSTLETLEQVDRGLFDIILKSDANTPELRKQLFDYVKKLYPSATQEQINNNVNLLLEEWRYYFTKLDPYEYIKDTKVPVLALNGNKDVQILSRLHLPAIEKAAMDGGNKSVTVMEIEGLNHLFQECNTGLMEEYGVIEQTFSPKVLEIVKNWILVR